MSIGVIFFCHFFFLFPFFPNVIIIAAVTLGLFKSFRCAPADRKGGGWNTI